MSTESESISNEQWELEYVAKKYDIFPEDVMKAKRLAGTDNRQEVYQKIEELFPKK